MPKTELGGLLIARGLLTAELLERALERQRSFGGRIGTCLLEIGALREEDLLEVLSEQLDVPAATADDLREISPALINLLPRAIALNCSAVPFREANGRIEVAVLDPGNFALEDELAFSMDQRIRSHIANEARIVEALHHYYGGDIPLRFKKLLERDQAPLSANAGQPPVSKVPAYLRPGAESAKTSRQPSFSPPKFDRQAISLTPEERAALDTSRDSLIEEQKPSGAALALDPDDFSHELYGHRLSQAETASQIGAALIQILARHFAQVLLFRVSSGHEEVTGWMNHGSGLDREWFRHYSVSLHHATAFRALSEGAPIFAGRLDPTPAHRAFARCWDGSLDEECMLLPVSIRGKLVCIAWARTGTHGLEGVDLQFMQSIAKKTALAFERCILRRKLQAT